MSLSPSWDYTQFWVWWLSNTAMGAMDTHRYVHSSQGNYIPGTGIGWGTEPCRSTYSSTSENFVSAVRGTVCLCSLSHLISTITIPCASQSNQHYFSWGKNVAAMLCYNPVPWASVCCLEEWSTRQWCQRAGNCPHQLMWQELCYSIL